MSEDQQDRRGRGSIGLVLAFVALLLLPAMAWAGASLSAARFSAVVDLGRAHVSVGTVDITVGTQETDLRATNLAPGDTAIGSVVVRNAGTLPLRYRISLSLGSEVEDGWIVLRHWKLPASAPADSCNDESFRPSDGGTLVDVAAEATPGIDTVDRSSLPRLEVGSSRVVCVEATVTLEAGNGIQDQAADFGVVVDAVQDNVIGRVERRSTQ